MAHAKKDDNQQDDYQDRLVSINRVSKVIKGGRRFGFAALMVVGDGKGRIGYGSGKAQEVPDAIKKAAQQAKRNMVKVALREGRTLHHDIETNYGSGRVRLRSAPPGTGIIAGGPLRAIFEVLGVQDVVAKSIGSQNPYNMVKATFKALQMTESPRDVARRRGLKVADVVGNTTETEKKTEKKASTKKTETKSKDAEKATDTKETKAETKKKAPAKKKTTAKKKSSTKKTAAKKKTASKKKDDKKADKK